MKDKLKSVLRFTLAELGNLIFMTGFGYACMVAGAYALRFANGQSAVPPFSPLFYQILWPVLIIGVLIFWGLDLTVQLVSWLVRTGLRRDE